MNDGGAVVRAGPGPPFALATTGAAGYESSHGLAGQVGATLRAFIGTALVFLHAVRRGPPAGAESGRHPTNRSQSVPTLLPAASTPPPATPQGAAGRRTFRIRGAKRRGDLRASERSMPPGAGGHGSCERSAQRGESHRIRGRSDGGLHPLRAARPRRAVRFPRIRGRAPPPRRVRSGWSEAADRGRRWPCLACPWGPSTLSSSVGIRRPSG